MVMWTLRMRMLNYRRAMDPLSSLTRPCWSAHQPFCPPASLERIARILGINWWLQSMRGTEMESDTLIPDDNIGWGWATFPPRPQSRLHIQHLNVGWQYRLRSETFPPEPRPQSCWLFEVGVEGWVALHLKSTNLEKLGLKFGALQ